MANFKAFEFKQVGDYFIFENWNVTIDSFDLADFFNADKVTQGNQLREWFEENAVEIFDDLLECVEGFASQENLIQDEDELNEAFKQMLLECFTGEDLLRMRHDHPMLKECFNSWLDGLVSDGSLHSEQAANYDCDTEILNNI